MNAQLAALLAKVDAGSEAQQRAAGQLGDRVAKLEAAGPTTGGLSRDDVLAIVQDRLVAAARSGTVGPCGHAPYACAPAPAGAAAGQCCLAVASCGIFGLAVGTGVAQPPPPPLSLPFATTALACRWCPTVYAHVCVRVCCCAVGLRAGVVACALLVCRVPPPPHTPCLCYPLHPPPNPPPLPPPNTTEVESKVTALTKETFEVSAVVKPWIASVHSGLASSAGAPSGAVGSGAGGSSSVGSSAGASAAGGGSGGAGGGSVAGGGSGGGGTGSVGSGVAGSSTTSSSSSSAASSGGITAGAGGAPEKLSWCLTQVNTFGTSVRGPCL